jgi:hypothetical protein
VLYYNLLTAVESGYVDADQGSKVEEGADERAGPSRRQDALGAAGSEAGNAAIQICVVAAVAEDETLGAQRTEFDSGQRRMGRAAVGVGGVVGDPLRTVKRDRLARTTTSSGHY